MSEQLPIPSDPSPPKTKLVVKGGPFQLPEAEPDLKPVVNELIVLVKEQVQIQQQTDESIAALAQRLESLEGALVAALEKFAAQVGGHFEQVHASNAKVESKLAQETKLGSALKAVQREVQYRAPAPTGRVDPVVKEQRAAPQQVAASPIGRTSFGGAR